MGNDIKAGGFFFFHGIQNLIDHVQIQLVDQSRVLQGRDEVGRGQNPFFRIDPSRQRFHIANPFSDSADDRLEIHLNPFFFDRPVNIFNDIPLMFFLFPQFLPVVIHSRFIPAAQGCTGQFCPVAGNADMNVFILPHINAHMDRQHFSAVHLPAFTEQLLQFFFQIRFFRQYGEVIGADPAALFISKCFRQYFCKGLQQCIPLRKTVLHVEVFHAAEIHIQQHILYAFFLGRFFACLCQFKEIGHVRKTGQVVIPAGVHDTVLVKGIAQGLVQSCSLLAGLFRIDPFIGIPYMGQPHTRIRINMFPVSMHDPITGTVHYFCPIDHFILAALCGKVIRSIGDPGHIIRMHILVHVVIHIVVGLTPVFIAEKPAESVRKYKGGHPFVNELINGEGNGQVFQCFLGPLVKIIFLRGVHA